MVNRLALAALAALLLAGCPGDPGCTRNSDCTAGNYCSGGVCTQDCTPETVAADCSTGASCSSFGMCVAPPDAGPTPDGGMRDAPLPPADVGAACLAEGGTDEDGDGFCAGVTTDLDCDDAAATVHPGGTEVCTPSEAPLEERARDEDCDGAVDEGCEWSFGVPHWSTTLAVVAGARPTGISTDGLRLYLSALIPALGYQPFMATRPSLDAAFGPATPVAGTFGAHNLFGYSISDDELEMIAGGTADGSTSGHDLFIATRAERSAPFGAPSLLELSTDTANEVHPALSRDGREIIFRSTGSTFAGEDRLYRARRTDRGAPFGAAEPLVFMGLTSSVDSTPWLSRDGRTLIIRSLIAGQWVLFRAVREAGSATFHEVTELTPLTAIGADQLYPVWSESTMELFFASTRPWSPAPEATWRVRVCLDGACPVTPIACPSARRSDDGQHCYTALPAPSNWGTARARCRSMDGHLVDIHSAAEQSLAWSAFGGTSHLWLALTETTTDVFVWDTGAPATYTNWRAGEPNASAGEEAVAMYFLYAGAWADVAAGIEGTVFGVCETEMWPTW